MEVGVYQWFALSALSLLVHDLNPSSSLETDPISLSLAAVEDAYEWIAWKQEHQRNYSSNLQELERYIVWRSNKFYVRQHNSHSDDFGYTLKMNQFGDMTSQEYVQYTRCLVKYNNEHSLHQLDWMYFNASRYANYSLPNEVDWRTAGAVTGVKDQGRCNSCYAFSVTGALEGMSALSSGTLVELSEQNIIDCSVPYGNRGCSGGSRESSLQYVIDNNGIDVSKSYPYIAKQYLCRFAKSSVGAFCTGTVIITEGSEDDLQIAVAVAGPITTAIDARHSSFQFYYTGIYSQPSCSRTKLTHSMLIVGYGTLNGHDYWLVKNSWGTTWGKNGFILMSRNSYNQCGIATRALYPTT